ncbi:MAG: MATE family efflux transporter [Lachnospiraceae bacterium]|nr:MATE family efflux transporter [Lachnospiraceae bacterium]
MSDRTGVYILSERQENKMGVMPVGKLLVNMSTPMMLSMLTQALYNIVDSIFVAMISEKALTAVSLAFPLQTLMIAFAIGTGVGVNALVSRHLGAREFDKANEIATTGVRLSFVTYVVFALFITLCCRPFFRFQTADTEIVEAGIIYMQIVGVLSIGMFFQSMMEKLLQATGKTSLSMTTQIVGAVINMIMDPILIFGYFGFPKMGIAGAATATIFGQIVAGLLALYFNKTKNTEIQISMKKYPFKLETVQKIYAIGVPSIIMQAIGSVMTFGFNKILIVFSATATALFGVYFKLQSFVLMPVFGLNNGMMPIVAYNYGARKPERIVKTMKLSYGAAYVIMIVGVVVFWVIPDKLLMMFSASEDMIEIGVPALKIISLHFLLAPFSIVSSSFFQALGHGFISMINSIIRQLLVLLPAAFILSRLIGLSAVWWSFPIAELAAVAMAAFFMIRVYNKEIKPLF